MSSCYLYFIFLFSVEWQRNGDYGGLNYGCIWILILFSHVSHPFRSLFSLTLQSSTYYAITFIFLLHINDRMPRYQFFNRIIHIFSLRSILEKKSCVHMWYWSCDCLFWCTECSHVHRTCKTWKQSSSYYYRLIFLSSSPPLHNNLFYAYVIIINGSVKMSLNNGGS